MIKDWWKWGDIAHYRQLDSYPEFKAWLESRWECSFREHFVPPARISVAELPLKKREALRDIFASLPVKRISFKDDDRIRYAIGKSYPDLINICKGNLPEIPDAVLQPSNHNEVEYILLQASQHDVAVIPYGGGTNLTGALQIGPAAGGKQHRICLHLGLLDKMIEIDEDRMVAGFQAGIKGNRLEQILNERGFTIGHSPESFEYSTLGGWIATRAAGLSASYFGKAEDLVEHLRVATPNGTVHTPPHAREAGGVNIMQLFAGSEGTLGIITEATLRIKRVAKSRRWIAALLPDFNSGIKILQQLARNDVRPSFVRFSDAEETALHGMLWGNPEQSNTLEQLRSDFFQLLQGGKTPGKPHLMLLSFEEGIVSRSAELVKAKEWIEQAGGRFADAAVGDIYAKRRFETPYLRDALISNGLLFDTFETVLPWGKVHLLHDYLGKKARSSIAFGKEKGWMGAHIGQIYPQGAGINFTIITRMHAGTEAVQWRELKQLTTESFLKFHGAVSHQLGVGTEHRKWYLMYSDPLSLEVLRAAKKALDPKGVLNPGKLFDL